MSTFVFYWDNFALGMMTTTLIECLVLSAKMFNGRINGIQFWLLISVVFPFISVMFRNGIFTGQSVVVDAIGGIFFTIYHQSTLILAIYRLRLFDVKGVTVTFTLMDKVLICTQLVVLVVDLTQFFLEKYKHVRPGIVAIATPIYYMIEVGHEMFINILLLRKLRSIADESKNLPPDQKEAYQRDRRELIIVVVLVLIIDATMVILAYTTSNIVFLVLKRLAYQIKGRLSYNMFSSIKENHCRKAGGTTVGTTAMTTQIKSQAEIKSVVNV
ncbi:hypothetical protein HK102_006999 [Quaeritorhiza haematococci]|nr:hypothetical protein HK102_006999 [Quaeritorhiza haematococci]